MAYALDQFVLDSCWNAVTLEDGTIAYWRDCIGEDSGYLVLYADGNHLHTYHHPENFLNGA
jgi:hypothetical protein